MNIVRHSSVTVRQVHGDSADLRSGWEASSPLGIQTKRAPNKHSCDSAGDWLSNGITEAGKEGQAETGLLGPWAGVWMELPGDQVRASKGCKCTLIQAIPLQ